MCGFRFPFLLVDRVIELELQKYAIGYKNVTANDNFFTGHFPDRKIMPGKTLAPLNSSLCRSCSQRLDQQEFTVTAQVSCK